MATILIIDDLATVLMSERFILSRLGHNVITALSADEALEKIENQLPDIVFYDLTMSGIDGPTFCRLIKNSQRTRHIPIVMVTTQTRSRKLIECMEAGCEGYLAKPLDKAMMEEKISSLLPN